MKPDESEDALLERYRRASAADASRPVETTRSAILAEANRVAAEQSRADALKPFDTRQDAANRGRFRVAAFGTLGATVVAALLAVPLYLRAPPRAPASRLETPRAHAPVAGEAIPTSPKAEAAPPEPVPETSLPAPARVEAQRSTASAFEPPPSPSPVARPRAVAPSAAPAGAAAAATEGDQPPPPSRALDAARGSAGKDLPDVIVAQQARRLPPPLSSYSSSAQTRAARGTPAPLLQAVRNGDLNQTTQLLDQGASLRESDDAGRSALFLAVMARRADLVRVLLTRGADPSAADRSGQTPLEWARQQDYDDMVQLLDPTAGTR